MRMRGLVGDRVVGRECNVHRVDRMIEYSY
jgi:hypothetical protein